MSSKFSYKKAAAEVREEKAPPVPDKPKPPEESVNQRLLRVLKTARERLQGTGMPERDVEVDEMISEVEGWGEK